MAYVAIILIAVALLSSARVIRAQEDLLTQENASGSAVVLLAIARIQQSGVFGDDNDLLRRIAYVETRDGTSSGTFRKGYNGGIWAVDENAFLRTQDTAANPRLRARLRDISEASGLFDIDWQTVTWNDLRRPIYSALAARLILFTAASAVPQTNDLEAQAQFWINNYNMNGAATDFVSVSSGLEGSILESAANEFFLGFSRNAARLNEPLALQLFITTTENEPVDFAVNAAQFVFTGTAMRNSSTLVSLPNTLRVESVDDREKGIHVKAEGDKRIVVYGLSYKEFSSDAFLALPCNRLAVDEYEYYSVSYFTLLLDTIRSIILIVGCEDNTVITTPSTTFTINRLQTYMIENSADHTGTRITSDKPIAFFSNDECTNIPQGVGACDHITEQLPPTSTWGRFFLVASLLNRSSGEIFRMVAGQDAANITVNCSNFLQPQIFSISSAGGWEEFRVNATNFCSIESSVPLLLSQFALGNNLDGVGDPFHMMIPPVEQYSNNYVFNVLQEFATNAITIYVAPEDYQPEQIFVDGMELSSSPWSPVHCSERNLCGYITRIALDAGEHQLFHLNTDARVGVSAYGFNSFNSYGYPGGLKLIPVQLASVSFAASSYQVLENSLRVEVTVTRSGDSDNVAIVLVASDNVRGTASVMEDFLSVAEILEFQPGETEKVVTVRIRRDSKIELDETFELYLTAGAGVHLSPFPRTEITIENDDGMISLDPAYGSMLGGTAVMVTSVGLTSFFKEEDDLTCTLDGVEMTGVFVNGGEVLCITPQLSKTGRLVFQVAIDGQISGEATFTSLSFQTAYNVYIANEEVMLSAESELEVRWYPNSVFPMAEPHTYYVNIDLFELNPMTGEWSVLYMLAEGLPNTGMATVKLPADVEEKGTVEGSATTVVIRVTLGSAVETEITKRGAIPPILQRLSGLVERTAALSPSLFLTNIGRQIVQRTFCEFWGAHQPSGTGDELLRRVPGCPQRLRDIEAPNSGFTRENLSSTLTFVDEIQQLFNTTSIDNLFQQFFHPGTDKCFRQRIIDPKLTGGSAQQCCYDSEGNFLPASRGGGTVDKVSPSVSYLDHFVCDVVPFLLCCKAGSFSNCEEYYRHRPSGESVDYSPPPPPAIAFGDPHIVTLDGHKYTFNGKGEYTLIDTPNKEFSLQGRMEAVNDQGTVFTAIVASQSNSEAVQFEITRDGPMAFVDGEEVDFTFIKEHEFSNVTVTDSGNRTFSAAFSNGVYIEVRESMDFFSAMAVSLPLTFMDVKTSGLMGSFNGNISDDLLPNLGSEPLSLNATLQEIHEKFGVTWIIDSPARSIFTYQPGESWATYYDPFFVPIYEPVFEDEELGSRAREVCGDDKFCLFDIAATERVDIGQASRQENEAFDEMIELQTPIVCDPPCVNGVCVENDTCVCEAGYSGRLCTGRDFTACGGNPCQNGGRCLKQGLRFLCTCQPPFTGDLCEFPKTCTISEPLEISPFNGDNKYSLRGSCEYVALSSCDEESNFMVTVDFLTGSLENGAVGVSKSGDHWISREDGSTDITADVVSTATDADGNTVTTFPGDVVVTVGSGFNRLRVGDGINVNITHQYVGNAFFEIQVGEGSLLETCGVCGNLNGQLLQRSRKIARFSDVAQVDEFSQSYLVDPRLQSLRPQRRECGIIRNDTVIGNPLYTVPIYTTEGVRDSLCFQIYGLSNKTFNLVSDTCVSVNAFYSPMIDARRGNVISQVSVRAVDDTGRCSDIHVTLDGCRAFVNSIEIFDRMSENGVSVRKLPQRVRIAAHNCENVMLVMWAVCETQADGQGRIHFTISRGLNLRQTSHGLIGQFWNVPALYEPFTGSLPAYINKPENYYSVSVTSASDPDVVRRFLAERGRITWNKRRETCLYAGNAQGGAVVEVDEPNDSVIEGSYKDYQVNGLFEVDYIYSQFEEDRCLD